MNLNSFHRKSFLLLCLVTVTMNELIAQRFSKFESTVSINGHYIPYESHSAYFGIITDTLFLSGATANGVYYYFYLPDSVTEIGARAVSPVPELTSPRPGDACDSLYFESIKTNHSFFDVALRLEYAPYWQSNADAVKVTWRIIATNDDSKKIQPQPDLNFRNALLYKKNNLRKTKRKLPPGLYRIQLTNIKQPFMTGSFLVEVGLLEKYKKLLLYPSLELLKQKCFDAQ